MNIIANYSKNSPKEDFIFDEFLFEVNNERTLLDKEIIIPKSFGLKQQICGKSKKIKTQAWNNLAMVKKYRPVSDVAYSETNDNGALSYNALSVNVAVGSISWDEKKEQCKSETIENKKNQMVFEYEEDKERNLKNRSDAEELEEKFRNVCEKNLICELIFDKDVNKLAELLDEFESNKELKLKLLNQKDTRGNTPIILCLILRSLDKCNEYLEILQLLINHGADSKLKNPDLWSPIEIATSYTDVEAVCIVYDSLLARRVLKIRRNKEKICGFLSEMPNFSLEMSWQVHIPLISFICPNDVCTIWKYGKNVKMDYTFKEFKNLKSIRNPSSFLFKGDEDIDNNVYIIDLPGKTYYNPFENLDEDERKLIIGHIMSCHRMHGEFKLKTCELKESKSFWKNKNVYENINEWSAQKYEINITTSVNLHLNEKYDYLNLQKENYLNASIELLKKKTQMMDEVSMKNHIANSLKVKNTTFRNEIMKIENNKDQKLKAYVWIAENYPIKSSHLVTLMESLAPANELTQKVKEFLNNSDVRKIIEKNGFPVKIQIPYNFLISFTVTFFNYREISRDTDPMISENFDVNPNFRQLMRKDAEKLAEHPKKCLKYANIR